jgi:hypothetical protein
VISDATKPRISFSLCLQPFNSSIGQRGGYGFFVANVLCSLAAQSIIRSDQGSVEMSPDSALLSWRDLRSTPDRRSPVSCFSSSERMSVPDRRSFEARLSSPDRFSSLPIVVSVGLPRIMLDRARLSHESRAGGLAITGNVS